MEWQAIWMVHKDSRLPIALWDHSVDQHPSKRIRLVLPSGACDLGKHVRNRRGRPTRLAFSVMQVPSVGNWIINVEPNGVAVARVSVGPLHRVKRGDHQRSFRIFQDDLW